MRRATIEDLGAAADTLAEAFEGYPWTRHVLPEEGYEERLRALQLLYLRYAQAHGIVAVAERGAQEVRLETSDPRNVRLYKRHGFRVVAHSEPAEGPQIWHMRAVVLRAHVGAEP